MIVRLGDRQTVRILTALKIDNNYCKARESLKEDIA